VPQRVTEPTIENASDPRPVAEFAACESAVRTTGASLDELATALPEPITSLAIRRWPPGSPEDIATLRRPPYESRADSVMYCQVLSEVAAERGWGLRTYDSKTVESVAVAILGPRAREILHGPRNVPGPPWSKDHRIALATTIVSN
jgi:hypothetical protein